MLAASASAALGSASAAPAPSLAPALTSKSVGATAHIGSLRRTAVLYSQNDNSASPSLAVNSQKYEPAFDAFTGQGADDFVVPFNHKWKINGVTVTGSYARGPAVSENVTFYKDANGLPGIVKNTQTVVGTDSSGSFTIPLSQFTLSAGTYWVSVQANLNFSGGGEWFWQTRTVQNGNGAAYQNPGDGYGTGCTTWARLQTCASALPPDFMFALSGIDVPHDPS